MFYFIETLESENVIENNNNVLCKDTLKEYITRHRRDDGFVNIGYLKEKLIQSGFEKKIQIKKLLLQYPDEIGISQYYSTTFAYIR